MELSVKVRDRNPAHTYQEWRELAGFIFKDEPKPMLVDEGKTLYVIATGGSDIERLGYRGISQITFTAFDPYFYGREHEVSVKSGSNTFYVQSAVEVWPVIELTGVSNNLTITNNKTGDKVVIPSGITSTSKVVINPELTKCTVNGAYVPINLTVTDYFSLPPGEANISLSSGSGVLRYKERYL